MINGPTVAGVLDLVVQVVDFVVYLGVVVVRAFVVQVVVAFAVVLGVVFAVVFAVVLHEVVFAVVFAVVLQEVVFAVVLAVDWWRRRTSRWSSLIAGARSESNATAEHSAINKALMRNQRGDRMVRCQEAR